MHIEVFMDIHISSLGIMPLQQSQAAGDEEVNPGELPP